MKFKLPSKHLASFVVRETASICTREFLETLKANLLGGYRFYDGKIWTEQLVCYHNGDYKDVEVKDQEDKIEALKAIDVLLSFIEE